MRLRLLLVALLATGCPTLHRTDEVDVAQIPPEVREDYSIFAQRCSKCHSLARPLGSGIDDDEYWRRYVARMRAQPASGISEDDVEPILRFLHYFSEREKERKSHPEAGAL